LRTGACLPNNPPPGIYGGALEKGRVKFLKATPSGEKLGFGKSGGFSKKKIFGGTWGVFPFLKGFGGGTPPRKKRGPRQNSRWLFPAGLFKSGSWEKKKKKTKKKKNLGLGKGFLWVSFAKSKAKVFNPQGKGTFQPFCFKKGL